MKPGSGPLDLRGMEGSGGLSLLMDTMRSLSSINF